MERRKLEVLRGNEWIELPWSELYRGDVFKLIDPDGTLVTWNQDGEDSEFVALEDPVQKMAESSLELVWSVTAQPKSWELPEGFVK